MSRLYRKVIKEFFRTCFSSAPLLRTRKFKNKVLDLGCGRGFYFKINPFACGIDFDVDCVRSLKNKGYRVIYGDIRNELPFKDNFFKYVICHDVLEHLEKREIEKVFVRVCRILEHGGIFLVLTPNRKGFEYGLRLNAGHRYFITPEEIFLMANGKFTLERHFSYPLPRFIGNHFTHNKEVIVLRKNPCCC